MNKNHNMNTFLTYNNELQGQTDKTKVPKKV